MVTGSLQGIHGHAHRLRQSSAAEQSQMLNISFQSIAAGLHAGSYQSQEVVKQDIQEICRSAAEVFSNQDQVCLYVGPTVTVMFVNSLSKCCSTCVGRLPTQAIIFNNAFCGQCTVKHKLVI